MSGWNKTVAYLTKIPIETQDRKKTLVYFLNSWDLDIGKKIAWIQENSELWGNLTHPKFDSFYTKWINPGDIHQLNWISHYFEEKGVTNIYFPPLPQWRKERHLQILANIDGMADAPNIEKRYFFELIKRSWSQAKYRKKRQNKCARNFLISKTSDTKLDHLADAWHMSKSAVVDTLIRHAQENNRETPLHGLHDTSSSSVDSKPDSGQSIV